MRNKLSDLNNYLFAQLERLDDDDLSGEELKDVIERGRAIASVATQIIANGNLQLKALSAAHEMGVDTQGQARALIEEKNNGEKDQKVH